MRALHQLVLLAATTACLALYASPGYAQGGVRQLQALTDTGSVRIDVALPASGRAFPLRGEIRALDGGALLWQGELGTPVPDTAGALRLSRTVGGLRPRLWSPAAPHRYEVRVTGGAAAEAVNLTARVGFRRFEERAGLLLLNGQPIFLRGSAINPPDRSLPDSLSEQRRFAADWVTYMKRINVNAIRLSRTSRVWLEVCDSLGILVFQGLYGSPIGSTGKQPPNKPFADVIADYRRVLDPLANHPSVVIYVLANELPSRDVYPVREGVDTIAAFMTSVYRTLRQWDPTRAYIGNAGFGFGRSGDICDTHHYWGWYYATVLSFYTLRDPHNCWRTERKQPLTVSESVGSYTGPDGRFNIVSDSKQLSAQLNFTGHAPDAEQAARALRYQAFAAGQAIEIVRRTRALNPHLAGIMPFTIPFSRWWDIGSFADMAPKPVAEQYARSYSPVLLSWELWTPQVYAGTVLRPVAHVVNDDTLARALSDLALRWRLVDRSGAERLAGTTPLPAVPYFAAIGTPLSIPLPATLAAGTYALEGVLQSGTDVIARNATEVFVAPPGFAGTLRAAVRRIRLYDPAGGTARAFRRLQLPFTLVTGAAALDARKDVLVVGARAWDEGLAGAGEVLRAFVRDGGRVLVLEQDPARFDTSWLSARVRLLTEDVDHPADRREGSPFRNGMAVNPERPDHPLFDGVDRDRLFLWSDPSGWSERSPGFPAVYPAVQGFVLEDPATDLARVALLADYGPGLQGIALAELVDGAGSVLLSGLGLIEHAGVDPVADRMIVNALSHQAAAALHHAHPLITAPITWGEYGSERGLVVGVYHGLTLNTVPVVPPGLEAANPWRIDADGWQFAGARNGWNSRPAITYRAQGRRAFGPYTLDLYNTPTLPKERAALGAGRFWCRVPPDRRSMITTAQNPSSEPLPLEISVNGTVRQEVIAAGATLRIAVPLPASAPVLEIGYRADRRVVLLTTEFQ